MELKLNIYDKRKVEKTYTAETYDLMFGTVEDLFKVINLDRLKSGSDVEIIKLVGDVATKSMDIIKPLLKDVFEGLTDEELRKTRVKEIAAVLVEIIKFSIAQIGKSGDSKN